MLVGRLSFGKVSDRVSLAFHDPLGAQKSFNSNWSTSMNSRSTDADLGAQSKAIAIRKASRTVVKDASTIDALQELCGRFTVLGNDRIGVATSERVNVVDSFFHAVDNFDRALQVTIFDSHRLGERWSKSKQLLQLGAGIDGNTFVF